MPKEICLSWIFRAHEFTNHCFLFPKGEFLRTHRVGPFGLSVSLFLGLLVLDFYHSTNRDLYLVGQKELDFLFNVEGLKYIS